MVWLVGGACRPGLSAAMTWTRPRRTPGCRIDLNMVRAGAVRHPSQWEGGASAELTTPPARGRIIDRDRLLNCLECVTEAEFGEWYEETLRQACACRGWAREPYWTEAAAVGGREWIGALASRLPVSWRTVELIPPGPGVGTVAEAAGTYVLHLSKRRREGMLDLLGR